MSPIPDPPRPAASDQADPREYPRALRYFGNVPLIRLRPAQTALSGGPVWWPLERIATRLAREPALPVKALVFHCSRCGSTLLARLFSLVADNRVLAEPAALANFLGGHPPTAATGATAHDPLQTFVQAFGLTPLPPESRLIIKLNSHALWHLDSLRAAFPEARFVYLYRDPVAVVASLAADPPRFLHPSQRGELIARWGAPTDSSGWTDVEWHAWYVDRNLRLAATLADRFDEIIDHRDLAPRYLELVNTVSGSTLSPADPRVADTLVRHSKDPGRPHRPAPEIAALAPRVQPLALTSYLALRRLAAGRPHRQADQAPEGR